MNLLASIQLTDESLTVKETASVLRILATKKVSSKEEILCVNELCSGFIHGTYNTLEDLKQEAFDLYEMQLDYCLDFEVTKTDVLNAYNAVFSTYMNTTSKEVMSVIF